MTSTKTILAGVALSVAGFGAPQVLASEQGYTLVNTNSTVSIQQVWAAHAGETDLWKPASMRYAIAPGTESTFTMSVPNSCFMDLKVRFSDGYSEIFSNVNVCRRPRVTAS